VRAGSAVCVADVSTKTRTCACLQPAATTALEACCTICLAAASDAVAQHINLKKLSLPAALLAAWRVEHARMLSQIHMAPWAGCTSTAARANAPQRCQHHGWQMHCASCPLGASRAPSLGEEIHHRQDCFTAVIKTCWVVSYAPSDGMYHLCSVQRLVDTPSLSKGHR
jgi:hypothetical protein